MSFYFKILDEGYVQSGNYEAKLKYKPGVHHVQGLGQVAGNVTPKNYPDNFGAEYNTFVTIPDPATVDPTTLYDRAAYNTFESPYIETISYPKVKLVTFMYLYDTNGVRPSRTLVEFDGSLAALTAKYPELVAGKLYTEQEYYETFVDQGFNRYGKVFPRGMHKSGVDELRIVTGYVVNDGDVEDSVTGADVTTPNGTLINLYVSPLWIHNAQPTFAEVYLHGEAARLVSKEYDPEKANMSSRMARWLAFSNEGNRSFINFQDHSGGVDFAARFGSNPYGTSRVNIDPSEPDTGEQLTSSYAYNVTNTIKN